MHNGSYLDPPGVGKLKVGELLLLQTLEAECQLGDETAAHALHPL